MNILFLSHYFPPEVNAPASRTYEHCRHWVAMGHAVTVMTCAPNHPRGVVYPGYSNKLRVYEDKDGISVQRIWTYLAANKGFGKRSLNYVSYMFTATIAALFVKRPDLVVTTSPHFFNGLAGYLVSRLRRIPWVLEIRDLWPESILTVGAIKNKTVITILKWVEMFAYHKANQIVVVTDSFKKYMVAKGIAPEKIDVLKNGAELAFYKRTSRDENLINELGIKDKFVVSYFGTHGMAHKLETILEAAKLLEAEKDVVLLMIGDGAEKERLQKQSSEMGLHNIKMLPQQAKEKMPKLWALTHVSLVLLKKSDLFKTVIPSKIFESMAMECPIILGVEGESKELVNAAGAGICIEPENATELAAAILALRNNPQRCLTIGKSARGFVVKNYDRRKIAERYLQVFSNVITKPTTASEIKSEHQH